MLNHLMLHVEGDANKRLVSSPFVAQWLLSGRRRKRPSSEGLLQRRSSQEHWAPLPRRGVRHPANA